MTTGTPPSNGPELRRVRQVLSLLRRHRGEVAGSYDDVAGAYDEFAAVWDGYVAAPALCRVEDLLRTWVQPGAVVLDAGTGTGERLKTVLSHTQAERVIGLDVSSGMLAVARSKIHDERAALVRGDLAALPLATNSIDVVCCTWAVEILSDPRRAVQEFVRVIKPDGIVIYAFCSLPDGPLGRVIEYVSQHVHSSEDPLSHLLAGADQPFHRCVRSSLQRFSGGLTSVATVAKCCPINADALPCQLQTPTP